jgi:hypothetical protein
MQSEPDLPDLPVGGGRVSSIVAQERRIHPRTATAGQANMRSTPPVSDPLFRVPSEFDDVSMASSTDHQDDASERTASNVKRRERGLISIPDPNLKLVTEMVSRRVMEYVLFVNAFPTDDELDTTLAKHWKTVQRQVGFVAQRTKRVSQVVSAIFLTVYIISNFGSSARVYLQLEGILPGEPNLLSPSGTTTVTEAPIRI